MKRFLHKYKLFLDKYGLYLKIVGSILLALLFIVPLFYRKFQGVISHDSSSLYQIINSLKFDKAYYQRFPSAYKKGIMLVVLMTSSFVVSIVLNVVSIFIRKKQPLLLISAYGISLLAIIVGSIIFRSPGCFVLPHIGFYLLLLLFLAQLLYLIADKYFKNHEAPLPKIKTDKKDD